MSRFIFVALLTISSLLMIAPVAAQNGSRDRIQQIEQEYSRQNNGQMIPDNQLEYYIDQSNSGWSMSQISEDMGNSKRQYTSNNWRPRDGWIQREVICSSINNQYQECSAPFRGTAVVTEQISSSSCIKGRSWGEKPGAIWVNSGCRARFGIVTNRSGNTPNYPDNRQFVTCQSTNGRYQQCNTGFRGRVSLVNRLRNSKACIAGSTWGQREGMVWVSRGCRAKFASVGRTGRGDDSNWNNGNNGNNGNWNRDNNYSVTCSSQGDAMTRCDWDSRYGSPRLMEQLSTTNCVNGRNWGYESNRGIWVTNGCRARFTAQ